MLHKVGVLTFARSEYSSFKPLLRVLSEQSDFQTLLFVSGMHLSSKYGETVKVIESDGFNITEKIPMDLAGDTAQDNVKAIGQLMVNLSDCFALHRPDLLLLVGDRYELLAAASTALVQNIPIGHISGGDNTEGAIDNQVRNAVTKMSHLHFVSMEEHAQRVLQMGEEPWRVHITGDPALDELRNRKLLTKEQLEQKLSLSLSSPLILVTYHPTTLANTTSEFEMECLIEALESIQATMVLTYPNADAGNHVIIEKLKQFSQKRDNVHLVPNLGDSYYSMLSIADVLVGNSSSGIWEAPSFRLPAVNIGQRQSGRLRAGNVIDVPIDTNLIKAGIQEALTDGFKQKISTDANPYGDGHASERIVQVLREMDDLQKLLLKKFVLLGRQ